jgi:hypothetical protein
MTPTLACCAQPFGYGPAAKLVAIAEELRRRGFRLVFVGDGVAHELAARSPAFDEVVRGRPSVDAVRSAVATSAGVLSVMDREFATLATELRRPLFLVDSLAWLRDSVPEPFRGAARYWVQRFPDGTIPDGALEVGPVVAECDGSRTGPGSGLVANLGGGESPDGDDPTYAEFVVRGLEDSGVTGTVLAGSRWTAWLRERFPNAGLTFESVSHEEAVRRFAAAGRVLTAPGLTASLECFRLGVPTTFLPPQNYSQWRILRTFRRHGLAPTAFHWEDEPHAGPSPDEMPETERTPRVREIVRTATPAAAARFRDSVKVPSDTAVSVKQQAFFAGLGPNGVQTIVDDLTRMCHA